MKVMVTMLLDLPGGDVLGESVGPVDFTREESVAVEAAMPRDWQAVERRYGHGKRSGARLLK